MKYLILAATLLIPAFYAQNAAGADVGTEIGSEPETQKVEVIVDSYSFEPDRIEVTEGKPVELILRSVTSMIPHNFTIDDPASGLDVDVDVPSGEDVSVTFTPLKTGEFKFYCDKKGIFGSHMKKGMEGTIVVSPSQSQSD